MDAAQRERHELLRAEQQLDAGCIVDAEATLAALQGSMVVGAREATAISLAGEAALRDGRIDEAERQAKQAAGVLLGCAPGVQETVADLAVARSALDSLVSRLALLAEPLRVARSALAEGQMRAAVAAAAATIAALPSLDSAPRLAAAALIIQATALEDLHDRAAALVALDSCLTVDPGCCDALWARASLHVAAGRHAAGLADLRRLSVLDPQRPGLLEAMRRAATRCTAVRRAAVAARPPSPPRYAPAPAPRRFSSSSSGGDGGTHAFGHAQSRAQLCATLGVGPDADLKEVRAAYLAASVRFHPDKHATSPPQQRAAAEEHFKAVAAAYQALMHTS